MKKKTANSIFHNAITRRTEKHELALFNQNQMFCKISKINKFGLVC